MGESDGNIQCMVYVLFNHKKSLQNYNIAVFVFCYFEIENLQSGQIISISQKKIGYTHEKYNEIQKIQNKFFHKWCF